MSRRQPPKQQLEDVLQDPNASWQEIRKAMKSSSGGAGCTNAAVMRALSTRGINCDKDTKEGDDKLIATTKNKDELKDVAKDGVIEEKDDKVIPLKDRAAALSARLDTVTPIRRGSTISENSISENSISENKRSSTPGTPGSDSNNNTDEKQGDNEKQVDITNSQNRRPSRRGMMRRRGSSGMRGSRTGSFRLSRQSSSKRSLVRQSSLKRSDSSKKSDSGGGEWSPAQMSIKSSVNMMDFGFDQTTLLENMDTLSETHSLGEDEMGKQLRRSVLSQESDSSFSGSGYLGWANGSDSDASAGLFSSGILHSSLSHLVDSSGFLDWDPSNLNLSPTESISKDEIKQRCEPISAPPLTPDKEESGSLSTKKEARVMGRLASDLSRHIGFAMSGEDCLTTMLEDSTRSSTDAEKGEDREWNIEDYENPQDNAVKSKPLRGTLFGGRLKRLSSVSSNINGRKKDEEIQMNDIKDALFKQVARDQPNTNCKPSKPLRRRRSTIDNITGALPTFLVGGETRTADTTTTEQKPCTQLGEADNRGAIWIKGGQDIRKLYEEQKEVKEENEEPKKGVGRFLRRITIEDDDDESKKKRGFLRRATFSD